MPEQISQEKIAQIISFRKKGMTFPDIAKELGMGQSTVGKYFYEYRKKYGGEKMLHTLSPAETNKIINLTQDGLSASEIAEKTGLSVYNVYKARKNGNITHVPTGTRKDQAKRDKKIYKLKMKGMTSQEIADKLHQPKSTIDSAYYRYRDELNNKGGMKNGSIDNTSSDEPAPNNTATTGELFGVVFAETNRLITNLSERVKVPADKLRRRLSELLAGPTLR